MLLLHGFPETATTWTPTMAALANAGFRAVAPFMRGYHPTQIPDDGRYDSETLARDAAGLIPALGADRAIVVGHDWGALAAYGAATLAPEVVELLVALAIPHPASIRPGPRIAWGLRHFVTLRRSNAAAKVRANEFAYVDELYRRWSPAWRDLPPSESADVKVAFAQPGVVEAACGYYRAAGRPPETLRRRIQVPTIAFAGEHDIIAPRAYEKARHLFERSYEVVQIPGGHFMHREHPDVFHRELLRVLAERGA